MGSGTQEALAAVAESARKGAQQETAEKIMDALKGITDDARKLVRHKLKMYQRREAKKARKATYRYFDGKRYSGAKIRELTKERGCGCQFTKSNRRAAQ